MIHLLLLLALACRPAPECSEDLPCGLTETCVEGVCQPLSCATSAQCPLEQHCADAACVAGCTADSDCFPGDACERAEGEEVGSCAPATCEDSHVDCAFGEFCDHQGGDCYDAEGYYCRPCGDDADCGGGGNVCLSWGDNGHFCGVRCEAEQDCPSGYTCTVVDDAAGNVTDSLCITWCWMYEEELGQ